MSHACHFQFYQFMIFIHAERNWEAKILTANPWLTASLSSSWMQRTLCLSVPRELCTLQGNTGDHFGSCSLGDSSTSGQTWPSGADTWLILFPSLSLSLWGSSLFSTTLLPLFQHNFRTKMCIWHQRDMGQAHANDKKRCPQGEVALSRKLDWMPLRGLIGNNIKQAWLLRISLWGTVIYEQQKRALLSVSDLLIFEIAAIYLKSCGFWDTDPAFVSEMGYPRRQ